MRPEPLSVIDMVDDAFESSEYSCLTGHSEGHSTAALSNVEAVMAPEPSTNFPQPTTLDRKDVVAPPKETVPRVVATQGRHNAPTVTILPPPVRVPIVPL